VDTSSSNDVTRLHHQYQPGNRELVVLKKELARAPPGLRFFTNHGQDYYVKAGIASGLYGCKNIEIMIDIGAMTINKNGMQDAKSVSGADGNYEYAVPAVDRAARILQLLRTNGRGMTIAEVSEATDWHKSSVHKILVTLNHHGLLDRNETTKQYSLGLALIDYGQFVLKKLDVVHAARTFLKELSEFSGETANYSILRGMQLIIVDSVESEGDLRVVPPIGTVNVIPTKSTGKAALAFMPEEEIDRIIDSDGLSAFTKYSITDREAFRRELALIRKRGYAVDLEEFREGISAISAPVFNSSREIVGTLSLVAPAFRMTKDKASSFGKKCSETAARLSTMIR
jgi:IclR family transcriptional regulator, KDG regulon repressor